MAKRSERIDRTDRREPLRRIGLGLARLGDGLALYGTVLVLATIGGLKFTAYEAEATGLWSRPALS